MISPQVVELQCNPFPCLIFQQLKMHEHPPLNPFQFMSVITSPLNRREKHLALVAGTKRVY